MYWIHARVDAMRIIGLPYVRGMFGASPTWSNGYVNTKHWVFTWHFTGVKQIAKTLARLEKRTYHARLDDKLMVHYLFCTFRQARSFFCWVFPRFQGIPLLVTGSWFGTQVGWSIVLFWWKWEEANYLIWRWLQQKHLNWSFPSKCDATHFHGIWDEFGWVVSHFDTHHHKDLFVV